MSWSESLIKLSTYEVETLQKRLAEIGARRDQCEMRQAILTAEGEAEVARAAQDPSAGFHLNAYLAALRGRKEQVQAELDAIAVEELGARDALTLAFEEQKKYEHVAETARRLEQKEVLKREIAALDELGLRRASR